MGILLALIYLAFFGIAWPIYLGGRMRGGLMWLCIVAPYLSFWFGYLCSK